MKTVKKSLKFLCVFVVLFTTIQFMQPLIVHAEAAPPVTSVNITDVSITANGHAIITVRVVGYGSISATIDGKKLSAIATRKIGNPVHTFVYQFDCGNVSDGSSHYFIFKATSLNRPRNTLMQNWVF